MSYLPEVVDIGSVRERLWGNLCLMACMSFVLRLARHLNVVRCHDSIVVASIYGCLDGSCLYGSIYFVWEVNIFRGWVYGSQAYQGFYCGCWVEGDCIGTFVLLAWAMLDAERLSETFSPLAKRDIGYVTYDCSCFTFNRCILTQSTSMHLLKNLLPANTMHHPLELHTGAFSVGHVQYFCNNRKPMPSLLQSGARQVTLLMSKVVTPSSLWSVWIAGMLFLGSHSKQSVCFSWRDSKMAALWDLMSMPTQLGWPALTKILHQWYFGGWGS